MLAVQLAGGCVDVIVPTVPAKLADGTPFKLRLPHRLIAECLDSEWSSASCGSFPGGTDIMPCLPGFLNELLGLPFPTRAEADAAVDAAFRVLLELAGPIAGTHTKEEVTAARQQAAMVLAAGELLAGRDLASFRPEFSIAAALKVLSAEQDPFVMTLMIRILGTYPSKLTPLDTIDSAVLAIRNAIKSGKLDEEDAAFAVEMIENLKRLAPRVTPTTPPTPPPKPQPKVAASTSPTGPRIAPLVFGIVLAAGLGAVTVWALRRSPRPAIAR